MATLFVGLAKCNVRHSAKGNLLAELECVFIQPMFPKSPLPPDILGCLSNFINIWRTQHKPLFSPSISAPIDQQIDTGSLRANGKQCRRHQLAATRERCTPTTNGGTMPNMSTRSQAAHFCILVLHKPCATFPVSPGQRTTLPGCSSLTYKPATSPASRPSACRPHSPRVRGCCFCFCIGKMNCKSTHLQDTGENNSDKRPVRSSTLAVFQSSVHSVCRKCELNRGSLVSNPTVWTASGECATGSRDFH